MTKAYMPPRYRKEEIWKIAEDFRDQYWDGTIPVDIEQIVEFELNLDIEPIGGLREHCNSDAMLLWPPKIIIDKGHFIQPRYESRVRFSIAHEIGHYVIHRDFFDDPGLTTEQSYLDMVQSISAESYEWMEYQANEFAGRLLVPIGHLRSEYNDKWNLVPMESRTNSEKYFEIFNSWAANAIARKFKVSDEVVRNRLKSEKLRPES